MSKTGSNHQVNPHHLIWIGSHFYNPISSRRRPAKRDCEMDTSGVIKTTTLVS